jgi:hypothetical protein
MKLTLVTRKIIRPCVALWPVDMMGNEELARTKEGTEFYTELTTHQPGTLKQIRTARYLANILFQNDPQERFSDIDDALSYLMVTMRLCDTRISPVTGATIVVRKSLRDLSLDEMSGLISHSLIKLDEEIGTERPDVIRTLMEHLGETG